MTTKKDTRTWQCPVCGKPMERRVTILGCGWWCAGCTVLAVKMGALPGVVDDGKPADESRAATSTATEESCGACDGAGELDGEPCGTCASTGKVRAKR